MRDVIENNWRQKVEVVLMTLKKISGSEEHSGIWFWAQKEHHDTMRRPIDERSTKDNSYLISSKNLKFKVLARAIALF